MRRGLQRRLELRDRGPARADMICGGGTTIMRLDTPRINRWLRDMIAAF